MKTSAVLRSVSVLCLSLAAVLSARAAHPFICTDSYGDTVSVVSGDGGYQKVGASPNRLHITGCPLASMLKAKSLNPLKTND